MNGTTGDWSRVSRTSGRQFVLSRFGRQHRAVLERLPFLPRVKDLARLALLELADDAVFGHEVDQPRGAAVADAQGTLQERARAAALADHDLDGRLVELVALLQPGTPVLAGSAADLVLHHLAAELDRIALQILANPLQLSVGHISPLRADDLRRSRNQEQHVAVAQQPIGADLIEDHPRITTAGDLERDPGRHVSLDQAGD